VKAGRDNHNLSVDYFKAIFQKVKSSMSAAQVVLTSDHFSASASGETTFRDMIVRQVRP